VLPGHAVNVEAINVTEGLEIASIVNELVAEPHVDVVTVAVYMPGVDMVSVAAVPPELQEYVPTLPVKLNVVVNCPPAQTELLVEAIDKVGDELIVTLDVAEVVKHTLEVVTV